MGLFLPCKFKHKARESSVNGGFLQNVVTHRMSGGEFTSRLDNEASFLNLLKVKMWCANCASVPPPALVISSQRSHIHSARGQQREWTCSRWMSARWQPRKLWIDSVLGVFIRILSKQDRLTQPDTWQQYWFISRPSKRLKHSVIYYIFCIIILLLNWKNKHW